MNVFGSKFVTEQLSHIAIGTAKQQENVRGENNIKKRFIIDRADFQNPCINRILGIVILIRIL